MTAPELFHSWLIGRIADNENLYGVPIFWIARAGKIVQLLSGSVILLNIVGIEAIRTGGVRIRDIVSWKTVFSVPPPLKRLIRILQLDAGQSSEEPEFITEETGQLPSGRAIGFRRSRNPNYSPERNAEIRKQNALAQAQREELVAATRFYFLTYVPGLTLLAYSVVWFYTHLEVQLKWLIWLAIATPLYLAANFLTLFILVALVRLPLLAAQLLLFRPIGHLLSNEHLERIALVTSFLLLIVASLIEVALS